MFIGGGNVLARSISHPKRDSQPSTNKERTPGGWDKLLPRKKNKGGDLRHAIRQYLRGSCFG